MSNNNIQKVSIRFFNDREVRAVWDETLSKWWFSVLDVVGVLNNQDDYTKNRNYWKYLKTKLKKEGNELVSATNQLKLLAQDGKRYKTDVLDTEGILQLAACFPNTKASRFVAWLTNSEESIDGRSTRIWLDLMLKKHLKKCIDLSMVNKKDYLAAMTASVAESTPIKQLLKAALTDKINDRETFMKGIDYSYYYEQED